MSIAITTNIPDTNTTSQAETIRNTMSFANLLTPTTPTSVDFKASTPEVVAPATPPKETTPPKEEIAYPDSVMSDLTEFDGTDSTEGADDVNDADREFICMNDEFTPCKTGQYTKDLSRKVISDHFGRNKACTRDIVSWPLFCRKHYQRATYNKAKWQLRKVSLILRQFDVIESEFPGTTYDIHFKKSEENRLNQYSRLVAAGMAHEQAEKLVHPVGGKHFEAPIDVLRELDQWLGEEKSVAEVKKVVDVILQMLEGKETEQVPSIEFLPQLPSRYASPPESPAKGRASKSPKTPKAKKPRTPKKKTPKTTKTKTKASSHVSAKGSVKKATQKA